MADGNKERALLLMTNHVQAANAIYKNTGFADANKPEGMKALTYYTVVVHGKALKCIQMEIYCSAAKQKFTFPTILNINFSKWKMYISFINWHFIASVIRVLYVLMSKVCVGSVSKFLQFNILK